MTAYLTAKYFVGELLVPNVTGASSAVVTANLNNLKWYIGKYEPDFVEKLLGSDLYEEYLAGLAATNPAAKWTNLKNKIYIVDAENDVHISPAANYVYYHIMRSTITATTAMGEIKPKGEGGVPTSVSNTMKMVCAWNQMAEDCAKIWAWLEENNDIYPSFDPLQDDPFGTINMFNI